MTAASAFRAQLMAGQPLYGAWSTIPSPLSVRLLAAAGLDYVVVDLQHGAATEHDLPALTTAIRLAGGTPIGRVRHAHPADIGRALGLGCEGVIVPNVSSAAQARAAAGACRYPRRWVQVRWRGGHRPGRMRGTSHGSQAGSHGPPTAGHTEPVQAVDLSIRPRIRQRCTKSRDGENLLRIEARTLARLGEARRN